MADTFYTFEHEDKASEQAHEHVTIAFREDGRLEALSLRVHEGARLTRNWDEVGTYTTLPTGHKLVDFTTGCNATDMVATALHRMGYVVTGVARVDDTQWGRINVLQSDGIRTDPNTLRGEGRNKDAQADRNSKRRKELGNALMAFGARGARKHRDTQPRLTIDPATLRVS